MSGMHGGETDAQRQDMLATARRLTKDFCLRPRPRSASIVRVLLFHIPVLDCTQWAKLKHFHRRYGEMQTANRPSFAYFNADNCLSPSYANNKQIATCVAP